MSKNEVGTIFSGQKRKTFEETQTTGFVDQTWSEKLWSKFKKLGKYALFVALSIFVVFLTMEYLVAKYVYKFTESLASEYDWLGGWIVPISFVSALVMAWPLLWAILNCAVGRRSLKHWLTLLACFFAVIGTAWAARDVYFADGVPQKEICAPTTSEEFPNISLVGKGETRGQICTIITKKNIGMAKRVRKSMAPKEIWIQTSADIRKLKLYVNGAPALYRSVNNTDGFYKLYDGPWFDDETGELLEPVKKKEELSVMETILRARELKAAAKKIADEETKKKEFERAESEKKMANAKAEAEKVSTENKKAEKIAEAVRLRTGMSLRNLDFYTIPYGLMVVMSTNVRFKVDGVTHRNVDEGFFKKNNGKVKVECDSFISCENSQVIMQKMID